MNATIVAGQRVAKRKAAKAKDEGGRYELTRVAGASLDGARIACAYRGLSLAEYLSLVIREAADRDIEEGHRQRMQGKSRP